jgi:hypothetical protein
VSQNLPSYAVIDRQFSEGTIELHVASTVRAGADSASALRLRHAWVSQ